MTWLPHLPVTDEKATTENFEAIVARMIVGKGAPEGKVGAPVGTLYLRTDGGASTTLYVKEKAATPTDPTGWVAK
jgi:hypothetical protein